MIIRLVLLFFVVEVVGITLVSASDKNRIEGFLQVPDLYSSNIVENPGPIDSVSGFGIELKKSPKDNGESLRTVENGRELEYVDLSLDEFAIVVYDFQANNGSITWVKVALNGTSKYGWVKVQSEMTYESFIERLSGWAQTTPTWNNVLMDGMGFGAVSVNAFEQLNNIEEIKTYTVDARSGYEVKVVDAEYHRDQWWMQVIFHSQPLCGSALHPRTVLVGWMPMYSDANELNITLPNIC